MIGPRDTLLLISKDSTMKQGIRLAVFVTALNGSVFAAPETFIIDGSHTFPRFSYNHFGYSTQLSRFNRTTGKIVLDKDARTGSVDVVIDMKSVDTGSNALDGVIQGKELLDTGNYPTATFKSTRFRFDGDKAVAVDGVLTIKGIAKPVTLTINSFRLAVHPMLKKEEVGADASTTIRRSDYNAAKYAPDVGDEVTINIAVEAIKE